MKRLWRVLFGRQPEDKHDEEELLRAVAAERARLLRGQKRERDVLADFRQAEAVIRGDVRSGR